MMLVPTTSRNVLRAQGEARALGAVGRRVPIAISRTGQGSNSATSRSLDRLVPRANGSQRVGKDGVPNPFGDDAGSNKQQEATGISQSAFDIVFGKPAAPKELYETIANNARVGMMAQVEGDEQEMDAVLAALHLAAEDDAIKTRTHIPLPVDMFSSRLDNMVTECTSLMPSGLDAQGQLDFVVNYLYNRWGLKIAQGLADGEYSPYRVYINNVLTQKCGTPSSSAALLSTLLLRMRRAGSLPALTATPRIGLPCAPALASAPSPSSSSASSSDTAAAPGAAVRPAAPGPIAAMPGHEAAAAAAIPGGAELMRWVSPRELLAEMLDQLKRFYWSWDWPLGSSSGFEACARSLLGENGRAGLVNAAVGVMQPRGRPFGNVELSVLATERAALVTRALDPDGWSHAVQVRDLGALYLHTGKATEGLALLDSYLSWVRGEGALLGPLEALPSTASPSAPSAPATPSSSSTAAEAASSSAPSSSAPASASSSETGAVTGGPAAPASVSERGAAPGAYADLVAKVVLAQRRKALESTFGLSAQPDNYTPTDDLREY